MAKYKADVTFKGKEEGKVFPAGQEFDMTVKRAEEIKKNIKEKYDIVINFERLDEPETRKKDDDSEEEEEEGEA